MDTKVKCVCCRQWMEPWDEQFRVIQYNEEISLAVSCCPGCYDGKAKESASDWVEHFEHLEDEYNHDTGPIDLADVQ
jgi:hypothetical protein